MITHIETYFPERSDLPALYIPFTQHPAYFSDMKGVGISDGFVCV